MTMSNIGETRIYLSFRFITKLKYKLNIFCDVTHMEKWRLFHMRHESSLRELLS